MPAWAVAVVAVTCVVGGAVLMLRPFTSVEVLVLVAGLVAVVTGTLTLVSHEERSAAYRVLVGGGWIVLGVVILAWPGLGVDALAVVVGVALLVHGAADVVRAVTRRCGDWPAELLGGVATAMFGILALSWPDATVFVVAVLFGARTVLFGVSQLVALIGRWRHPATGGDAAAGACRRGRRLVRLATRSVAVVVAAGLLVVSVLIREEEPSISTFYDAPSTVSTTPGELIRSEPFATGIPDDAEGWLILYSTTTALGDPTVASAIVLAPRDRPAGERPVVAWTHGTVGIARRCAPSLADDPFQNVPAVPEALDNGWVMVATDYAGMGTEGVSPYLIGRGQAYSALDAVRAAQQLPEVSLSDHTVVWGHSQGGHAALWTGMVAGDYAPRLTIDGVAALAPATDLVTLAQDVQHKPGGALVSAYVGTAYSRTYDDVHLDGYIRRGARVLVAEAARRCVRDPAVLASVLEVGPEWQSVVVGDFTSGPLGDRLRDNTPTADVGAPLLVAQGTDDEVIPVGITEAWVPRQCAAGHDLDFRTYRGLTHLSLVAEDSPLTNHLTNWTTARFAGEAPTSTC